MRALIDCVTTLPFWLIAFALEGCKAGSLRRRMRRCGRTITAADAVDQYVEHGGSLLVEVDRILVRGLWYTSIDVITVPDVDPPEKLQRSPGEFGIRTPFDVWCHNWLTNEASGSALLVTGKNEMLDNLVNKHAVHVPYVRPKTEEPIRL